MRPRYGHLPGVLLQMRHILVDSTGDAARLPLLIGPDVQNSQVHIVTISLELSDGPLLDALEGPRGVLPGLHTRMEIAVDLIYTDTKKVFAKRHHIALTFDYQQKMGFRV